MAEQIADIAADTLATASAAVRDIFGAASRLAAPVHEAGGGEPAAAVSLWREIASVLGGGVPDDWFLRLLLLAVALLYIFCIVRYGDIVLYFVRSAAGLPMSSSDAKTRSQVAEMRNVEIILCSSGALFLAIAATPYARAVIPLLGEVAPRGVSLLLLGVLACAALFKTAVLRITGVVSERADICRRLGYLELLHLSVFTLAALPAYPLFYALLPAPAAATAFALLCAVSLILFAKETFLLFIEKKVSILHSILYLCALELFPVSLLLAPAIRAVAAA